MLKFFNIILLSAVFLTVALVHADDEESYQEARRLTKTGEILPLQVLLNSIQAEQQGRVLEVELERKGSQYIYEIEILDEQGVVWEYLIDAANGQILKRELED
ncbi:MAG: PepSY domain-containing protein [Candidatus Thiodiazotropha sp. LLP2]